VGSAPAVLVAAALAGCGGSDRPPPAKPAAKATATASAAAPVSHARTLVRMTRVQGDDPLPFGIVLRADRSAAVRYGGGHGGFEDKAIRLTRGEQQRVLRALRAAPWRAVDGHTVTPGGFGGSDNGNRYSVYYRRWSTVLAQGHIPAHMARLLHLLDAIIEGDLGHRISARRHSPIPVTPAPAG
jgi:hypothetical protein